MGCFLRRELATVWVKQLDVISIASLRSYAHWHLVLPRIRQSQNSIVTDPAPKPRWFHLTPDRFVIGLLVVEGLLWPHLYQTMTSKP